MALTANQHDAIPAIELAMAEAERLAGCPMVDLAPRGEDGAVQPLITIVTDNGGAFRPFRFEAFIATRPELRQVRTPGRNGSRERGFGSLKYEKLFLEEIPDALDLVCHGEDCRIECNAVRPHEAWAWNRPHDVRTGLADPLVPNFPSPKTCQLLDAGHAVGRGVVEGDGAVCGNGGGGGADVDAVRVVAGPFALRHAG